MERCYGHFTVPTYNPIGILSENIDTDEHVSYIDQPVVPATECDIDTTCTCDADSSFSIRDGVLPSLLDGIANVTDFVFKSKGLHIAHLNIRHLLPKLDELRISMATKKGHDMLRICETFLNRGISCNQVAIEGFDHIRKDRSETQGKFGGGVILYIRNTIHCKRRTEYEISKIETIWSKITLPNSKPFLLCTATALQM